MEEQHKERSTEDVEDITMQATETTREEAVASESQNSESTPNNRD